MKTAFSTWKWSLGLVARSYRTVILLSALAALWIFGAYEWLGLPAESSALLMIVSFIWAVAQLLLAAIIVGGTTAGAVEASDAAMQTYPLRSVWVQGRKRMFVTLSFAVAGYAVVWVFASIFDGINSHSVEVASFLTFHAGKPVSYYLIEKIFAGIEWLLWIMICGFLLSVLITILRDGWRRATERSTRLLAASIFRTPFLTSLVSTVVFGGLACKLAHWHPIVPPGFWDYTQVVARNSLALALVVAGILFWSLSLARLVREPQK